MQRRAVHRKVVAVEEQSDRPARIERACILRMAKTLGNHSKWVTPRGETPGQHPPSRRFPRRQTLATLPRLGSTEVNMAIGFTPKVGQVLLCHFGRFGAQGVSNACADFNRRLPPEMVKTRLVVVINGRLSRQSCIVAPLSTTFDPSKMAGGVHVEIGAGAICALDYFTPCVRWAKADCIHTVSKLRLQPPTDGGEPVDWAISAVLLERIQRAAVHALNASALLIPIDERALLIDMKRSLESTT
ncbi:type II toxin-antitoxin system PemK/MazF family toxin [Roseateles chitinivorans]|uniref:type II toxin-antitoxin system PemK/MazF family toxin n=1 Tax=Roseateles chitinivorans TaxID=2917965 RepID=UPI003D67DCF2